MNVSKTFLLPPSTLAELNNAIVQVDHKNAFFEMDLRVVSKDVRFVLKNVETASGYIEAPFEKNERARIVLAEITNVFMRTVSLADKNEIDRFQELFSSYCVQLLKDKWSPSFLTFVEYVQYGVKKIINKMRESDAAGADLGNSQALLLLTDVDDQEHGAMGIRAARYLVQGIPVIMPYHLLCKMINYSFNSPWISQFQSEIKENCKLMTAKKVCSEITNPKKWKLYTNGNLVAVLPNKSTHLLNLCSFKEVSFEEVKKNAILRQIGEPYYHKKIEDNDIIDILSTDTTKHVVWAGHGSLKDKDGKRRVMGLTVEQVSAIFNRVKSVNFWDLHSCFLLGNIRKVMDDVDNSQFIVKVSNGYTASSYPPKDSDDMTSVYLSLASKAIHKGKPEKIAKIFPLMENFYPENHPHLILRDSREIVPLTFPGVVEKVSTMDNEVSAERLYIDRLLTMHPISLNRNVALLPGLGDENTHHFLNEVSTNQSMEEFIDSAFGHICESIQLFIIKKLRSKEGVYENVVYFSQGHRSKVIFLNEGSYQTFSISRWSSGQHHEKSDIKPYPSNLPENLQKMLELTRPSVHTLKNKTDDFKNFCVAVSETFNLPESWIVSSLEDKNERTPLSEKNDAVLLSNNRLNSLEEGIFFRALVHQDKATIAKLYKNFSAYSIKKALEFCIERDLFDAFSCLLNHIKEFDPDMLKTKVDSIFSLDDFLLHDVTLHHSIELYAIKMRRIEILKQLDIEYTEEALESAASYGQPAIFEFICKDQKPTNLKKLLSLAEQKHNWDMVQLFQSL